VARQRGFPARSRSRRLTAWAEGPESVRQTVTGNDHLVWTFGVATTQGKVTIVRIRGTWQIRLTTTSAVNAGFHGALGIGLVTTPAFDAGAVSTPGPLTEVDWDGWMWHTFFDVNSITAVIADGVNAFSVVAQGVIDSKAMRLFDEDTTLIGAVEVEEDGTQLAMLSAETRMLVKI